MEFRAVLLLARTTATGIEVPPEVVQALGAGRKPAVTVTINGGHSYPSTVATMGGVFMVPVSAENRAAAGVQAGDELAVGLVLDTAPRVLDVPADLAAALDTEPAARAAFDALSYSGRRAITLSVDGAKAAETRTRRITRAVADLLG